jgi:8-oxo-dGTP pyrophosphatase MutT (NUDIX family)
MEAQMIGEVSDEAGISTIHQACAVPFRRRKRKVEFCVITSSRGRWLFPKGCIGQGASVTETALKEAYEEAGLHGRIIGDPLGCYVIARNGDQLSITALLMEVENTDRRWPEGASRRRRWVTPGKARRVLSQSQLTEILDAAVARLAEEAAQDETQSLSADEVRIG